MKTPRELLMEKHRAAGPKLDRIRRTVLQRECGEPAATPLMAGWRGMVLTLRWHLAGLGAAWALIALLSVTQSASPALAVATPAGRQTGSARVATAVRENRRLLSELLAPRTEAPAMIPAPSGHSRPQSQARPPRMAMC